MHDRYASHEEIDVGLIQRYVAELVPRLQQFQVGESYRRTYPVELSTQVLQQFLDSLKEAGLDIGRGDVTFGYKMPLPPRKALERDLIIFRRR
ncbi:hypothetical protein HYX00_01590 [Candidatus Woesearchaeota archaeon]|nr:hypothetical protein [Candidatus Woesearchaeota archaeon]